MRPTNDPVRATFGRSYDRAKDHYRRYIAFVRRHAGVDRTRLLDIGCGPGDLLARCRDLGHAVQGVEPDPQPRAIALARGLDVHAGRMPFRDSI